MNLRSLLLLGALVGTAALRAQTPAPAAAETGSNGDPLNDLLKNSPFGQRVAEGSGPAQATALELRGVIFDGGEVLFSVYDAAAKSSRWVALNETGNPFTVRSYDRAKNEVKVNFQGRDLTLGLKQATVIALAAPPVPVGPPLPAPGMVPAGPPGGAQAGAPTDEAVRLAQIAQEISRRRALRQQAKQQSNSTNTPPPPGAARP